MALINSIVALQPDQMRRCDTFLCGRMVSDIGSGLLKHDNMNFINYSHLELNRKPCIASLSSLISPYQHRSKAAAIDQIQFFSQSKVSFVPFPLYFSKVYAAKPAAEVDQVANARLQTCVLHFLQLLVSPQLNVHTQFNSLALSSLIIPTN